uniref:Protein kinase domain-containing protein n=1 Tax=Oryza meridionalis TaxID=40149 RepID=A0A0E0BZD6_9ORYZ
MEYLHHEHYEIVQHCDQKPSNVLFDEETTVHVADFGIAKLLLGDDTSKIINHGKHVWNIWVHGTSTDHSERRRASESCSLKSSLESDLRIDRLFVGEVTIRQWVNQAFSAKLVHVLDDKLQLDESSIEDLNHLLLPIFEVGLLCSSDSPDQRMSMADVVVTLKKIRKDYEEKN